MYCATQGKNLKEKGGETCPKRRPPKGRMKQQPEFGLSEVYIGIHLALLPEPKLENVKYF